MPQLFPTNDRNAPLDCSWEELRAWGAEAEKKGHTIEAVAAKATNWKPPKVAASVEGEAPAGKKTAGKSGKEK